MTELRADCSRCHGLCCVALPFPKSADFAVDKQAGKPCGNLRADYRCGIHDRLRESGYRGCTVFECFGAGQRVSRGSGWRASAADAERQFAWFGKVRELHEVLWHIEEALALPEAAAVRGDLIRVRDTVDAAAEDPGCDVGSLRQLALGPLRAASGLARGKGPDLGGAQLIGRDLRSRKLRGASLRGAVLVGADLRGVDLGRADLTGADLRGADLRGADLRRALFLTQPQLTAAVGDRTTLLSPEKDRPAHWS
ncbi:pentapeptide repeat-containing protein [Actinokineospora guangxiensis]|uniref:Pentapeptide repeat-containing protein n=1 Tax=Actinokineospora guangxiensis TaxID=1490288 RepID=A0ABW0ER20_9PSEU